MNKKLIIFTDGFPYGKGEKTFIAPELDYLSNYYEITMVSTAKSKVFHHDPNPSPLPRNAKCIWCGKRRILFVAFKCLIMPFTHVGRIELGDILKGSSPLPRKIAQYLVSILYYGLSANLLHQFREAGVFDQVNDAVYYSFWFGRCAMALSIAKLDETRLRFISRIHGYELYNERAPFGRQPFQWFKRSKANAIVFAATGAQRYFTAMFGKQDSTSATYSVSRIGTSEYPHSRKMASQQHEPTRRPRLIVSCSNAIPLKRVELIAQAVSHLDSPLINWVHFGDGSELKSIKALSSDLRINAEFPGAVSNEKVKHFYAENDVDLFITTTSTEGGCPVSITEALSFGIPIIGTNVGGIPEQIDGNGILLDVDASPHEIADSIRKILDLTSEEREAFVARSLEIFHERFSLPANLKIIKSIIDEEFNAESDSLTVSGESHADNMERSERSQCP